MKNCIKKSLKTSNGITLIALVITVIVLLILAGISISTLSGENGILNRASDAKIMTELSKYKEELNLYKLSKTAENINFIDESLTAGKANLFYNTQKSEENGNIKTIIPDISNTYLEQMEIIKGELLLNTQDKSLIKIAQSLDIQVNPYDIVEGELLSSNGNLLLMDNEGTITIPDSVTKIGEGAFANVDGLKTIIIPGTVKEISTNAFQSNNTLENVILKEGIETIGIGAFCDCRNLKYISLPESLTTINYRAFYCCRNLLEISIPSNIEAIPDLAFSGCNKLNKVVFKGDKVKTIGREAFFGCAFSDFTITKNVESIYISSFNKCSKLETINIETPNFTYESGMLLNKTKDNVLFISTKYFENNSTLSIPEGITDFSTDISTLNITTLNISSTVNKLNARFLPSCIEQVNVSSNNESFRIFEDCIYTKDNQTLIWCFSKATDIILTNNATSIGNFALQGAKNAINITFANSTQKLQEQLFTTNVRNVVLGENISDISSMFAYTRYNINVTLNNNDNYIIEDKVLYTKDKKTIITVLKQINGKFILDSNVTKIEVSAFYSQGKMTEIQLTNNLKQIDGSAFSGCTGLTYIDIPKSVTSISTTCFSSCRNLNEIRLNREENSISGAPWGAPKGMKVVYWNN